MKTFLMLELPGCIKHELCKVQRQLPTHVDLVESCKLHLTMRFLGITTEGQREEIDEGLKQLNQKRFNLSLSSVGLFDNFYKVLWCGVDGQVNELRELACQMESICQFMGKPDFTFYPHITLGRTKVRTDVSHIMVNPIEFTASTIHLTETTKTATGTVYTHFASYSLK